MAGGRGSTIPSAWVIAGITVAVVLGAIVYRVAASRPAAPAPDMANNGATPDAPFANGPAPDISKMSPRERFDRLFDRVVAAAEQGDSGTAYRFAPMALGAYDLLEAFDPDARYHAAMIHLTVGEFTQAQALADSILVEAPGHLLGYVVQAEVAKAQGRSSDLARSYGEFLAHYDAEIKTRRLEYQEHQPVVAAFKAEAETAARGRK